MSKAEAIYEKVQALPSSTQNALLRILDSLTVAGGSEGVPHGELARTFQELAEQWRCETRFLSFMHQRALHPAYQRIIGMGWAVVPLILQELRQKPDHWLWALQAITGEEPAGRTESLADATKAWIRWGHERGLLPDA